MSARWPCALALGLAGCGGLNSTLMEPLPAVAVAGPATATLAPDAVDAELARLQEDLGRRVARQDWGVPLALSRGPGPWLRLRIGADLSFEPGSAQLRASALVLYAEIASVLARSPVVIHVVGYGDTAATELSTDLSARRAAAVESYLLGRGLPAARVRAEGRGAGEPVAAEPAAAAANRRLELVIRPVVAGREAEAWVPPVASCAGCAPHG